MIEVIVPNLCLTEIQYTFDCLLTEFLGLEYTLKVNSDQKDFYIKFKDKQLIIRNHFFTTNHASELYKPSQIPKKVDRKELKFGDSSFDLTAIYGTVDLTQEQNGILLDLDLVSSTFFMLSRWEENINPNRDSHQRFLSKDSVAWKNDFLNVPIVNIYVELIWKILLNFGYNKPRKPREFHIVPTHDVDIPYLWRSKLGILRDLAGKVYHRKFSEGFKYLKFALKGKDPYDTFDHFMTLSERAKVKSNFFFMTGGDSIYDNRYQIDDNRIIKLINKIKDRNHNIGLHPSYNSYKSVSFIENEKLRLEEVAQISVKTGRQHYLRFEIPYTWRAWNELGMKWDTTLTYADYSGFRCGVCYPFPVFDFLARKPLKLYEKPLIVMEASIIFYEKNTPQEGLKRINFLKNQVKKYNGSFVFLWHNSSFNTKNYKDYEVLLDALYE
jgi:hypothetical protein